MKIIWVTGSKGQLGTELSLQQNSITGFDFVFTDIQELDLRNENEVRNFIQSNKPSYIINCAAYVAVDNAETDQKTAFEINRDVPAILYRCTEKTSSRIIHISTDYVFDGFANKPYTETDVVNPQSVYGRSKLEGEKKILKGENHIVIRTSWMYSAYGNNFVKTILRLGREKAEINVVTDEVGSPTWAGDLAGAILHIIKKLETSQNPLGGLYQFCNKGACSRYDFALEIIRKAGLSCKVNPIKSVQYPLPAKRPPYAVMDTSKIKEAFELTIPHWKDSLDRCLKQISGK